MNERPEDLADLQAVLDRSFEAAGPHLRDIASPDRRLDAAQLAERLTGMRLLVLATSTSDGPSTGRSTASSTAGGSTSGRRRSRSDSGTCASDLP